MYSLMASREGGTVLNRLALSAGRRVFLPIFPVESIEKRASFLRISIELLFAVGARPEWRVSVVHDLGTDGFRRGVCEPRRVLYSGER